MLLGTRLISARGHVTSGPIYPSKDRSLGAIECEVSRRRLDGAYRHHGAFGQCWIGSIFLVDFVDLLFISMLGDPALTAAVGFASTLLFITFSVTLGLTIAIGALAARMIGSGNPEEARKIATSAIVFGIALSVIVSA
ncbi:MAG: MATE family efflux transporter, partial [Pseudomonadota bacterium]